MTFNPVLHEKDQPGAAIFCIAGAQTHYFLFEDRRAQVIKDKPQGNYWPPAQGGSTWEEENRRLFFIVLSRAPRSFSRARFAREFAEVLKKNEKKNKKSVYRLFFSIEIGSNAHEHCVTRCPVSGLVHSPGRPASVITWKISTRDPCISILGSQLAGLVRLSYNRV